MDIILVPGFWLDASSWSEVVPTLASAGHRVRALTLPGLEALDVDRSGIRLSDHVAAVVAAIDQAHAPVVLVGHSGGGPIAHGAVDARPSQVARIIFVDSWPATEGRPINDAMPQENGEIALPAWSELPEEDLRDLDDSLKDSFRARAIPQPAAVACDPQVFTDERRHDVPATVIACEFSGDQLRAWMARGEGAVAELAAMRDVEIVELPTGHWPQFTKPSELADAILSAVDRS
jgi:pimeloyl-ACP methyl ester carboxylesterase